MLNKQALTVMCASLGLVAAAHASPSISTDRNFDGSKVSLLVANVQSHLDCDADASIEMLVRAEIDKLEPVGFTEARDALVQLSDTTDTPCAQLSDFARNTVKLSETDKPMFIAILGLDINQSSENRHRGPEGNGGLAGFNGAPPASSSEQTSSDYQN